MEQNPRGIVEAAVKAMGGSENLRKLERVRDRSEGELLGRKVPTTATIDLTIDGDSKARKLITSKSSGVTQEYYQVLNGEQGWTHFRGQTHAYDDATVLVHQTAMYNFRIRRLYPLLEDPAFTLTLLPDRKVDGQRCCGVSARMAGRKDVDLYFDNKWCLRLMEWGGHDVNGVPCLMSSVFYDYQLISGVLTPKRTVTLAKDEPVGELRLLSLEFLDKIPSAVFDRP